MPEGSGSFLGSVGDAFGTAASGVSSVLSAMAPYGDAINTGLIMTGGLMSGQGLLGSATNAGLALLGSKTNMGTGISSVMSAMNNPMRPNTGSNPTNLNGSMATIVNSLNENLKNLTDITLSISEGVNTTNKLLQKMIDLEMGIEPIDYRKTAARNSRTMLTMARTAMGRLALAAMENVAGAQAANFDRFFGTAINNGITSRSGLVANRIFNSIPFLKTFSTLEATLRKVMDTRSPLATNEVKLTITNIIPTKLEAIGKIINNVYSRLSLIGDDVRNIQTILVNTFTTTSRDKSSIGRAFLDYTCAITDFQTKFYDRFTTFEKNFREYTKDFNDCCEVTNTNIVNIGNGIINTISNMITNIVSTGNVVSKNIVNVGRELNSSLSVLEDHLKRIEENTDNTAVRFSNFIDYFNNNFITNSLKHYNDSWNFFQYTKEFYSKNLKLLRMGLSQKMRKHAEDENIEDMSKVIDSYENGNNLTKLFNIPGWAWHKINKFEDYLDFLKSQFNNNITGKSINKQIGTQQTNQNNPARTAIKRVRAHEIGTQPNANQPANANNNLQNTPANANNNQQNTPANATANTVAATQRQTRGNYNDDDPAALNYGGNNRRANIIGILRGYLGALLNCNRRIELNGVQNCESLDILNRNQNDNMSQLNTTTRSLLNQTITIRGAIMSWFNNIPKFMSRLTATIIKVALGVGIGRILLKTISTMIYGPGNIPKTGMLNTLLHGSISEGLSGLFVGIKNSISSFFSSKFIRETIDSIKNWFKKLWQEEIRGYVIDVGRSILTFVANVTMTYLGLRSSFYILGNTVTRFIIPFFSRILGALTSNSIIRGALAGGGIIFGIGNMLKTMFQLSHVEENSFRAKLRDTVMNAVRGFVEMAGEAMTLFFRYLPDMLWGLWEGIQYGFWRALSGFWELVGGNPLIDDYNHGVLDLKSAGEEVAQKTEEVSENTGEIADNTKGIVNANLTMTDILKNGFTGLCDIVKTGFEYVKKIFEFFKPRTLGSMVGGVTSFLRNIAGMFIDMTGNTDVKENLMRSAANKSESAIINTVKLLTSNAFTDEQRKSLVTTGDLTKNILTHKDIDNLSSNPVFSETIIKAANDSTSPIHSLAKEYVTSYGSSQNNIGYNIANAYSDMLGNSDSALGISTNKFIEDLAKKDNVIAETFKRKIDETFNNNNPDSYGNTMKSSFKELLYSIGGPGLKYKVNGKTVYEHLQNVDNILDAYFNPSKANNKKVYDDAVNMSKLNSSVKEMLEFKDSDELRATKAKTASAVGKQRYEEIFKHFSDIESERDRLSNLPYEFGGRQSDGSIAEIVAKQPHNYNAFLSTVLNKKSKITIPVNGTDTATSNSFDALYKGILNAKDDNVKNNYISGYGRLIEHSREFRDLFDSMINSYKEEGMYDDADLRHYQQIFNNIYAADFLPHMLGIEALPKNKDDAKTAIVNYYSNPETAKFDTKRLNESKMGLFRTLNPLLQIGGLSHNAYRIYSSKKDPKHMGDNADIHDAIGRITDFFTNLSLPTAAGLIGGGLLATFLGPALAAVPLIGAIGSAVGIGGTLATGAGIFSAAAKAMKTVGGGSEYDPTFWQGSITGTSSGADDYYGINGDQTLPFYQALSEALGRAKSNVFGVFTNPRNNTYRWKNMAPGFFDYIPNDNSVETNSLHDPIEETTIHKPWSSALRAASQKSGIKESVLSAIIKGESNGIENATSKVGAYGLMQIMPKRINGKIIPDSLGTPPVIQDVYNEYKIKLNRKNTADNIMAGALYLKMLTSSGRYGKKFGFNNYIQYLRAYNGGFKFKNNKENLKYPWHILQNYGKVFYTDDYSLEPDITNDLLYKAKSMYGGKKTNGYVPTSSLRDDNELFAKLKKLTDGYAKVNPEDKNEAEELLKFTKSKTEALDNFMHTNPVLRRSILNLAREYYETSGEKLTINSSYRDPAYQAYLYQRWIEKRSKYPAALPGKSAHNYGMAFDINSTLANKFRRNGLLAKHGLVQPMPDKDAVHLELANTPHKSYFLNDKYHANFNQFKNIDYSKYDNDEFPDNSGNIHDDLMSGNVLTRTIANLGIDLNETDPIKQTGAMFSMLRSWAESDGNYMGDPVSNGRPLNYTGAIPVSDISFDSISNNVSLHRLGGSAGTVAKKIYDETKKQIKDNKEEMSKIYDSFKEIKESLVLISNIVLKGSLGTTVINTVNNTDSSTRIVSNNSGSKRSTISGSGNFSSLYGM